MFCSSESLGRSHGNGMREYETIAVYTWTQDHRHLPWASYAAMVLGHNARQHTRPTRHAEDGGGLAVFKS